MNQMFVQQQNVVPPCTADRTIQRWSVEADTVNGELKNQAFTLVIENVSVTLNLTIHHIFHHFQKVSSDLLPIRTL